MARDKVKIVLKSGYDSDDKDNKENGYYLTADTQGSVTVAKETNSKTDDKQLWWKRGRDEDFFLESIGNPGRFLISKTAADGNRIVLGPETQPGEKFRMEKGPNGFSYIHTANPQNSGESLVFHVVTQGNDNIVVLSSKEPSTSLWKIVDPEDDKAKGATFVP